MLSKNTGSSFVERHWAAENIIELPGIVKNKSNNISAFPWHSSQQPTDYGNDGKLIWILINY